MLTYILVIVIGGQTTSANCDDNLCFDNLSRCQTFAQRLNYRPEDPEIFAYCEEVR